MFDLIKPIFEGIDLSIFDLAILGTIAVACAATVILFYKRLGRNKRKTGKRNLSV